MSNKKKRKNSNYQTGKVKAPVKKKKKISRNTVIGIVCTAVILIAVALSITFCVINSDDVGEGACEYFETRNTDGHNLKYVKISVKNHGSMILLLDATTAPITVNNFIKLVNEGFYDGLTFHRILEDFMIQGGDPSADGTGGSSETIKGEFEENGFPNDISHKRGVISMARSDDMDSASSQFFICNADSEASLDGKYAAFGYVIAGLDVVDSITAEGMKYTSIYLNGAISDKDDQPVITEIVEISEQEALKYAK